MRHSDMTTTARFYQTADATRTAAELRKADEALFGNTSGNSEAKGEGREVENAGK